MLRDVESLKAGREVCCRTAKARLGILEGSVPTPRHSHPHVGSTSKPFKVSLGNIPSNPGQLWGSPASFTSDPLSDILFP